MTEDEIRADEKKRIGQTILALADDMRDDPDSDGADQHVASVLRKLASVLIEKTWHDLVHVGLLAIADEIRDERQHENQPA